MQAKEPIYSLLCTEIETGSGRNEYHHHQSWFDELNIRQQHAVARKPIAFDAGFTVSVLFGNVTVVERIYV